MNPPTIVIDNGGYCCRIGLSGEELPRCCFQNAIAKPRGDTRTLVGSEIEECTNVNQLFVKRPIERGYLVSPKLQAGIWTRMLEQTGLMAAVPDADMLLTEPLFVLPDVQRATQEMAFEDIGVRSLRCVPGPVCCMRKWAADHPGDAVAQSMSGVVLDAGFSCTTAVPILDGRPQLTAIRRTRVGGNILTNVLKEWISYRSLNLMDEPYLVGLIKEQVSYVAVDARKELKRAFPARQSQVKLQYVLPDGVHNLRGYVQDPLRDSGAGENPFSSQITTLTLNNERFMLPEVMFHPTDLDLDQAGVCEVIAQALNSCHPALPPLLAQNIILSGGTAKCPGFKARVEQDLRPLLDTHWAVCVNQAPDPAVMCWQGASLLATDDSDTGSSIFPRITRAQYEEQGAMNTLRGSGSPGML